MEFCLRVHHVNCGIPNFRKVRESSGEIQESFKTKIRDHSSSAHSHSFTHCGSLLCFMGAHNFHISLNLWLALSVPDISEIKYGLFWTQNVFALEVQKNYFIVRMSVFRACNLYKVSSFRSIRNELKQCGA